jgi:hypothetical protein
MQKVKQIFSAMQKITDYTGLHRYLDLMQVFLSRSHQLFAQFIVLLPAQNSAPALVFEKKIQQLMLWQLHICLHCSDQDTTTVI